MTQLDPYAIRPVRSKVISPAPAEKYGASTRTVLNEIGLDDSAIDELIEGGIVSESWSGEYLPS